MLNRTLHEAAATGDIQTIENYISQGTDLNDMKIAVNSLGGTSLRDGDFKRNMTPLHLAVYQGQTQIVQCLLHAKADVNLKDKWNNILGNTALEYAVLKKQMGIAQKLIDAGALDPKGRFEAAMARRDIQEELETAVIHEKPNIIYELHASNLINKENGEYALRLAARYNSFQAAEALLNCKVNPNAYEEKLNVFDPVVNQTPLGIAADQGSYDVAKLLLERKATVDQFTHVSVLRKDVTPLGRAIIHITTKPNPKLVELLLAHKANPNYIQPNHLEMLPTSGNEEEVELLLKNGLKANTIINGKSLLSIAVAHSYRESAANIAVKLIEYGANAKELNEERKSFLHLTSNLKVIKALIKEGLMINLKDKYGKTPLSYAVDPKIAEYLVESGADIMALAPTADIVQKSAYLKSKFAEKGISTHRYQPAIFGKIRSGQSIKDVKEVNEVNEVDWQGRSGLHLAVVDSSLDIVKQLITKKANINLQDNENNTPLHYAAVKGNLEAVLLLIEHKANINLQNNNKKTAFDAVNSAYLNEILESPISRYNEIIALLDPSLSREKLDELVHLHKNRPNIYEKECSSTFFKFPKEQTEHTKNISEGKKFKK